MAIPAPAFFSKMSETQRLVTSIVVIGVIGVGLAVFWILGLKQSHELSQEVSDLAAGLAEKEKKLDGFPDLQRKFRENVSEDRRLAELLPDQNNLDRAFEILAAVEEQAGKSGHDADFTLLTGKAVQKPPTGKPAGPQIVDEITLEMEAAGSWSGLVSFLDGLEHADRLMFVKSFKTTGASKTNPAYYTYKIVLVLFKMAAPPPPPAAAPAKKKA